MQAVARMTVASDEPAVDPRIARAAAGDREAAQALLTELLPRVRNLVRYLVRGDHTVDDITQQVLVELLRSFGGFRADGSLHAWVHRITVRVTLRQARKQRRERANDAELGSELIVAPSVPPAPDAYLRRRDMVALLDTLSEDQRHVLVLHHVVGLSVPELAQELAIPFETARSRLRLAMTKLRADLGASEVEHD